MADHNIHSVSDCICTTMDPKWAKKTCWRAFTHTELLCDRGKSLIYFHHTGRKYFLEENSDFLKYRTLSTVVPCS